MVELLDPSRLGAEAEPSELLGAVLRGGLGGAVPGLLGDVPPGNLVEDDDDKAATAAATLPTPDPGEPWSSFFGKKSATPTIDAKRS